MKIVEPRNLKMDLKENLYRLLLVGLSILLTLLLAEVGARIYEQQAATSQEELAERLERSRQMAPGQAFGRRSLVGLVRASEHEDLVYELKPGLVGTFLGVPFAFNSHGMRDHEHPLGKPDGTFRIAALGDSVMFGWGVEASQSYLEIVEQALNAGNKEPGSQALPFEVLSFAVPGYNTAMQVAAFERKALAFDPDLVIIHFVGNDFDLPRFMQQAKPVGSMRRSALVELVATRLGWLKESDREELVSHDLRPLAEEERQRVQARYQHMAGDQGFRRAMARLATLAERHDLPVLMIYATSEGEPFATAHQVATELGFETLVYHPVYDNYLVAHDIERTRRGWKRTFWLSMRDPHPNVLSHRLIASVLVSKLRAMGVGGADYEGPPAGQIERPSGL